MQIPNILRTTAERLSRGRTFKRNLRVGKSVARILVSGDAQLKYLKLSNKTFDQDLINIALACLEPTDIVWDVGANIGVFSVAAATQAKSAVAFEADIWLAELIRKTAKLEENRSLDIQVVPVALAKETGLAKFQIAQRGRASNALSVAGGRSQMGGVRDEVLVPTYSLDAMIQELPAPDFIKIDVEGAEMMVVSGGAETFRSKAPLVYVEVGPALYLPMVQFLADFGYAPFDEKGRPLTADAAPTANVFFGTDAHQTRLEKLRSRF